MAGDFHAIRAFRRLFVGTMIFGLACLTIANAHAGEITVYKAKRMLVYQGDGVSRSFRIGLGSSPVGPKRVQGDRKTPEGVYFIAHKNPHSQFYLSLAISYPDRPDVLAAQQAHRLSKKEYDAIDTAIRRHVLPPQNTALGGDIFIHGRGSSSDWTWGCVALDDRDMTFLFEHVQVGDKVTIVQ
ncbi:L,D-transpeptidase family protein [Rhodanobacter sp. L36]|uniref:L,D-transpeptidase family protein n=1 Tax=Rhodanobacter sp. L36 TaxID=1747221 RepID=UPI001C207A2E|nr:L,D-transpeptidase family protein [Rhodanobacter sp. L36]